MCAAERGHKVTGTQPDLTPQSLYCPAAVGESGTFPEQSPLCLLRALGRAGPSLHPELRPPQLPV